MPTRPARRPAGRASFHNRSNAGSAHDKPVIADQFGGICRGRPTCWTSGRSGGPPLDVRQVGQGPTRWEGRERVEKSRKMKVLRMKSSIVENVPTPWESLFELFPASQLPYRAKNKKCSKFKKKRFSPYFLYQTALELSAVNEMRSPEE